MTPVPASEPGDCVGHGCGGHGGGRQVERFGQITFVDLSCDERAAGHGEVGPRAPLSK